MRANAAASSVSAFEGAPLAKGQLYEAVLGGGRSLWLEVAAAKGSRVQLLCCGEAIEVNLGAQPPEMRHKGEARAATVCTLLQLCGPHGTGLRSQLVHCAHCLGTLRRTGPPHPGFVPRLSDPWVRRCPGLAESLQKIRQQQQQQGGAESPLALVEQHGIKQLRLATSLEQLAAEVERDPGLWCDGTGEWRPATIAALQCMHTCCPPL